MLKVVNSSTSIKELLHTFLNQTLDLLGAERGSILLFDLNSKELTLKIARGQETTLINNPGNIKQKIGEGISGLVAQERKPLLVKDINKETSLRGYQNRLNHYKTNSFLTAPLFVKDALIGIINVTDKLSKKTFSHEDLHYLSIISTQVSFSFERIKLIEETRIQNAEIAKLSLEKFELEKQLSLAKKFASLGKISSGIAHEINNPLDGVIRYTNLCLDRTEKENKTPKEYLLEIRSGLYRIANTISSLLKFSRHNTGSGYSIDINKTLDEVLSTTTPVTPAKSNIVIVKDYSNDIPLIPDKGIKHVFVNLIRNAYEAMEQTGGRLTISTGYAKKNPDFIELKINDTGCGIPEENRTRIFEPFFTTKAIGKGVGLGLAICYDIIERYNGKLSLENQTDKGTTFIVNIPAKQQIQ